MEKMIADYIKKTKELRDFGKEILNQATDNDWDNYNELLDISNLDLKLSVMIKLLEKKVD